MTADAGLLDDLVRSILTDFVADREREDVDRFSLRLWDVLVECGLTTIGIPESAGGGGGTLHDVAVVLRRTGEFGAPVPIAEHLLGQLALHRAGLGIAPGLVTLAFGDVAMTSIGGRWRVSGRARRVPFARDASLVVVADPAAGGLVCLPVGAVELRQGSNLAGEARDDVTFDLDVGCEWLSQEAEAAALRRLADVFRSVQISGAARGALDLTLRHAIERIQFGRRIAAFQAIQQQVAVAAAEVELLDAAADAAVAELELGLDRDQARLAALSCKACAGRAGGSVASIAHQVHGAIGVTREHELRLRTTRIWSWREELDAEEWCERRLAALATRPGGDLWALMTAT